MKCILEKHFQVYNPRICFKIVSMIQMNISNFMVAHPCTDEYEINFWNF